MSAQTEIATEAITRAGRHADPEFLVAAERYALDLARVGQFTSDELLETLRVNGYATHDNRAIGYVLRKLHHARAIQSKGYAESSRPSRHCGTVRVWAAA